MNPLSLVPTTWLWPAAAIVGAALLAVIGVQHARVLTLKAELAAEQRDRAGEKADAERTARAASERYRAEEQRRAAAQKEANDEAQRLSSRARSDAVAAGAAAVGLRDAARSAAGRCAAAIDPGAVAVSAPASAAGLVLAGVLGEIDGVAGELAAALDLAHIAGRQCEREHDALTR